MTQAQAQDQASEIAVTGPSERASVAGGGSGQKSTGEPPERNLANKTRPKDNPYEVWSNGQGWTWNVLRKYQKPSAEARNRYARWFCFVTSPICPEGEYGDVYVREVHDYARRIR